MGNEEQAMANRATGTFEVTGIWNGRRRITDRMPASSTKDAERRFRRRYHVVTAVQARELKETEVAE